MFKKIDTPNCMCVSTRVQLATIASHEWLKKLLSLHKIIHICLYLPKYTNPMQDVLLQKYMMSKYERHPALFLE